MFMEILVGLAWGIGGFIAFAAFMVIESFISNRKEQRESPRDIINFRATNW